MDFIDKMKQLSDRVEQVSDHCETEEATKTAMIMPFISALGYDVFNPTEVVPEFVADIGAKKGEKVDYAIRKDGQSIIFFECKWSGADLNKDHAVQLHRYFSAIPEVRFGVLTNGIEYRFYSDLDTQNRMDDKPFFVFNALSFHERDVNELKRFTKEAFDIESIVTTASDLKYTAAIKRLLADEFEHPSEDFVSHFAKQVYGGRFTQNVKEQFSSIVVKAMRRFLSEKINERLQGALQADIQLQSPAAPSQQKPEPEIESPESDNGIVTSDDEHDGFLIARAILRSVVDVSRVHMRDTKSYCGVLLDNNNRKPILRLHFNRTQKYVGVFDENRNEERVAIDSVDDIYGLADRLITTANRYEASG